MIWYPSEMNSCGCNLLLKIKDAEANQGAGVSIRLWVSEIRSIALRVEDIIKFLTENKGKQSSKFKLLTKPLCSCIGGKTNVDDITEMVKELEKRLSEFSRRREDYGIGNDTQKIANVGSRNQLFRDLRRTTSFAARDFIVGFADDLQQLETQLSSSELRRSVISIVGTGGLGKTTLALKLYNTNKGNFTLHAWVCVSQEWNARDLLERIIKSLLQEPTYQDLNMLKMMEDYDMQSHLYGLLKDKRYLLVLDDMWDEKPWTYLSSVLPDNQNRSRVIITSRNVSAGEISSESTYVLQLQKLGEHESWYLFCRNAFQNKNAFSEQECPDYLRKIGKQIVEMLDGLPLAITLVGGLLSSKQPVEWKHIMIQMWKEREEESIHISSIFDLSYNDLPRELKSCFLYMGIFPEDYVIHIDKLVQLWIAEDFIPRSEGIDMEELAESYIKELNARNLIQVIRMDSKLTCCVHDLLRYLVVRKAKDIDFFHIHKEPLTTSLKPFLTRKIAFRSGFENYYMDINDHSYPQVHTLSFLGYKTSLDDFDVAKLVTLFKTGFKSLRVLDLEGVRFVSRKDELEFFKAMVKLVDLRYFKLHITDIAELPKSMGNLLALQILDVLGAGVKRMQLPTDIYKLTHLRHLSGNFKTKTGDVIAPRTSFEDLTILHTLNDIDINGWLQNEESDELALKAFSKLHNIRILSVLFENANYRLSIEPLLSCKNLFSLQLKGSIKSLPTELHESLPCLRYVGLYEANFVQDPLPALEKLSNLHELHLDGFKVESLIITATGFYKLGSLSIRDIPNDMSLQIEEGALPSLKKIHIDPLINFTLPERFKNMST